VPAEGDTESEVSEWELQERTEREEDRRAEAEGLGAGEQLPLFVPTPSFKASAGEEELGASLDFLCHFLESFLLVRLHLPFL